MRDQNRIDDFCMELAAYWHKVPDWRFGQFVSNVLAKGDFFYKEEDDFLNDMKEFFDRKENKTDMTPFEVLETISTAYYGKQMYFLQDDGMVYDRVYGKYISLEEAINGFASKFAEY